MNRPEQFERSVAALVRAYFEGTLAKFTCVACACGNIVADSMGIKIPKEILNRIAENPTVANSEIHDAFPRFSEYCGWSGFTETHARLGHDDMTEYVVRDISKEASFSEISEYYKAVYRTGYDKAEMLRIETAFETNTQITVMEHKRWSADEIMQDQYVGLMAVVDVLCEIHGAVEDGSREETKARFIAAA